MSRSEMLDGLVIHTDLLSGDTIEIALHSEEGDNDDLVNWVEGLWDSANQLTVDGYTLKEESALGDQASTVYELTNTISLESGTQETWRHEIEFVNDAPILIRQAIYEVRDGVETLLQASTSLEYQVLSEFPPSRLSNPAPPRIPRPLSW